MNPNLNYIDYIKPDDSPCWVGYVKWYIAEWKTLEPTIHNDSWRAWSTAWYRDRDTNQSDRIKAFKLKV